MTFRYKVNSSYDKLWHYTKHDVKIQRYKNSRIFKWRTVADDELRYILYRLNKEAFKDFIYAQNIPEELIYNELIKYKSMDEVVMKYITDVVLEKFKAQEKNEQCNDMICKFVSTNDWKTIEIKESDE